MKVTNTQYLSIKDLDKNLDISHLDTNKTLIQVFSGFVSESEVKQIQSIIKNKNANIQFIGSTTAGEIYEGNVYENTINISVMEFDDTIVKQSYFIDKNDYNMGKQIATSLFEKDTKVVILFIDGIQTNANDVIDGISSIDSSVPIAGGLAGDNGYFSKTYIFDSNGVYSKGSVAASLNSKNLNVFTQYQLNWQAIGKTMTVTKVEKNRLYEIDGINVSEIYKKYLGEKIGENLPFSATEFPLLKIEESGNEVCRAFFHRFDDGSLTTVGNLEVGDKVRLSFGNVDLILNNTKDKIKKYRSFKPEGIFVYSCTARKVFLQSEIVVELNPLNQIATNIGFFTYGEIFHSNDRNALLSMSLTMLALSEQKSQNIDKDNDTFKKNKNKNNFMANKHYIVLEALTHLSNTVISELEEAKKQLKEQAHRDYLTGLYNRRYFNEIAQELIYITKRERKTLSVIMLDIDRFKSINDTYGHGAGDDVIKILSNTIIETLRDSDIVSRFGGEEFAILLPFTDEEGAFKLADKIRKSAEGKKIITHDGQIIRFTVSMGVASVQSRETNIEQALNRADEALYEAKNSGRNRVVVN